MASAKEMAYMRVYGVTENVLEQPEHAKALKNATADIMSYQGLYKDESVLGRDKRLEIESALYGESVEIADYFKQLYPERFKFVTSWDVVFSMLKDMNGADKTDDAKTVQALMGQTVSGQEVVGQAEASDHLIIEEKAITKEEKQMAEQTNNLNKALEELQNAGGLNPQDAGAAMPTTDDGVSKAALDAARKVINQDRDTRIAYTKNAKITRGIAMQPSLHKRLINPSGDAFLVKDGNAETAAKKAEKSYKTFCEKTGRRVTESGAVVFDKVRQDSIEDARKVDQFLIELKNNPTKALTMQEPSRAEQLKGGYLMEGPANPQEQPMLQKEILRTIIEKTLGRLNTACPESQFVVRKAINRTTSGSSAQGSEAVSTNTDPWKGVGIVTVIKKAEFEKLGYDYAYELDNSTEVMTGVRIQLPGKVYYQKDSGAATTESAEVKYVAFTLSGFAKAHGTKLVQSLSKFERKERGGVGSDNTRVLDFNNEADITAAFDSFNGVIASYLSANKGNVPVGASTIMQQAADIMKEEQAASVASEAAEMADIEV